MTLTRVTESQRGSQARPISWFASSGGISATRFLAKARKQKLTTKQLGLSQANAVYVNEHLTQANKQLLGAAIARKKEVAWKFVWTNGGKVYARKDEQMDAVRIQDLSDLTKMTK
ncbi:hypothetical protein HPB48_015786 [Haemaphysalis longicornis]|uniref:FP protein C-terminal domain-containing protein n=1 Tax=Haemaphysalis longicornis TaxID=44386 RepID=A0A9J6GWF8_HAELO|nr:hypothetical protein HPB48_015786 [Haemaphysalis longicornis]